MPETPQSLAGQARVLVTGSRDFAQLPDAQRTVEQVLQWARKQLRSAAIPLLVHGAARGLDSIASLTAQDLGWRTEPHPAKWQLHKDCNCSSESKICRFAGHRRNAEMIQLGAELVLSFPMHKLEDRSGSRGTWHCTQKASEAGLPVFVVWGERLYPFSDAARRMFD